MQVKVVVTGNNNNNDERNKQINKFDRLMGNKDKELTAKLLANNNQLLAQNNSNKWVVNLYNTPLSQFQDSLLSRGPNYAVASKLSPHLEYITSIESACQKLDQ